MNVDIQEVTAEVEDIVDREKRRPRQTGGQINEVRLAQIIRRQREREAWVSERLQP